VQHHPRRHSARVTQDYVFHQLVPYLGNKRRLLGLIGEALAATGVEPARGTFLDAFAGSGVVARFAKHLGFAVIANALEPYAAVLNTPPIALDAPPPFAALGGLDAAIAALNTLPGHDGWVTAHLCPRDDEAPQPQHERMFYRRATGRRIDAIRDRIAAWHADGTIDDGEQSCLLAPLLYQACWLANTSGVFKGFHAGWGGRNGTALHRILADLRLQAPRFLGNGRRHGVLTLDAAELPRRLPAPVDVAYLDPPYNQHPYASNYHVLHSLVAWDRQPLPPPTAPGHRAAIRADWRQRRSAYNHRGEALAAFTALHDALPARFLLTSYSTDGTIAAADLVAAAARRGALQVFTRRYARYRTSPTRPSPRPHTLEFVLLCDSHAGARADDVAAATHTLMQTT
jgi:adenine-specific DNA-methyltransferase